MDFELDQSRPEYPAIREVEPQSQQYFLITNVEAGIAAFGYIPKEAIDALVTEHFEVSGFLTDEGIAAWAVVRAHDIAQSLGADGHDPNYWPAAWWSGYADAFKGPNGEILKDKGYVRIPLSNGEIFEAENDDQILDFLESRKDDRP